MEYYCHIWAGAPSCYLELLDKLQNWICRTVGPSLHSSLDTLAHCQNVPQLSLFYGYYFGRCSSKLAQLVLLPFSQGKSTCHSDRLHDFCVTIPRCYNNVYVNSFFPHTARLWTSLPIEGFPLTYDQGIIQEFNLGISSHESITLWCKQWCERCSCGEVWWGGEGTVSPHCIPSPMLPYITSRFTYMKHLICWQLILN